MDANFMFTPGKARILSIASTLLLAGAKLCEGATTLVSSNAVWRYLENGSDQGTAWREPWYNDDDWGIGHAELGYGDAAEGRPEATVIGSPANGYITTYFRRFFYVTNTAAITNLAVGLMRDDGGVVYLNGQEIFRSGMPSGPIDYLTLAADPGAAGADEYTFFQGNVDPGVLFSGINLVAVEVHQRAPTSSDLSFALELIANPGEAPPPEVALLRGPYLQSGTTTSLVVRWRTDAACDSRVRYGLAPDALTETVSLAELTTEHIVKLNDLSPDTRYYYDIGTTLQTLSTGSDHTFLTAPAQPRPIRIWAIGDSGTASAGAVTWRYVRDSYAAYGADRHTDVWLMLGDNAYGYGTDDEYTVAVFRAYPEMLRKWVLWSTIGNHETYAPFVGQPISYFDNFTFPTAGEAGGEPSGTENYYSFNYGDVHFVCIDSELAANTPGSPMLTWLEADLAANTNLWTIAFWHSPPYNFGTHNSDSLADTGGHLVQMRENVVPILESNGVDLVLCGHSHTYERSFLLNGHYGYSTSLMPSMIKDSGSGQPGDSGPYRKATVGAGPNEGAVYVVAGSSGWVTGDVFIPQYLHPAMFIKLKELGSMVIDVDGPRLDAKFLRETGAIDDHFTILKGGPAEPLRFASFRVQNGQVTAQWKSTAGHTYRIQKCASMENPDWVAISDEIVATGATTKWSDAADSGDAYFRVVRVAP